jgi:hypothetical protein
MLMKLISKSVIVLLFLSSFMSLKLQLDYCNYFNDVFKRTIDNMNIKSPNTFLMNDLYFNKVGMTDSCDDGQIDNRDQRWYFIKKDNFSVNKPRCSDNGINQWSATYENIGDFLNVYFVVNFKCDDNQIAAVGACHYNGPITFTRTVDSSGNSSISSSLDLNKNIRQHPYICNVDQCITNGENNCGREYFNRFMRYAWDNMIKQIQSEFQKLTPNL